MLAVPEHKERKAKNLEVSTFSFSPVISWVICMNFEAKGGNKETAKFHPVNPCGVIVDA